MSEGVITNAAGETLGYGEITLGGAVYKGYFFSGSSKQKAGYGEIFYEKTDLIFS